MDALQPAGALLFEVHSALRFALFASALAAVVWFGVGLARRRPSSARDRRFAAFFAGLVDLQVAVGAFVLASGRYYPALMGHIATMLAAAVAAHVGLIAARGRQGPSPRLLFGGVALCLLLMVGGIFAIGRGPFAATAF